MANLQFFEKYLERSALQYVLSSDVDEVERVHMQMTAIEAIDRMLQRHLPKMRKKEQRFDEEDLRDVITDLLCDAYLMFWRTALPTVRDGDELPASMFIAHQLATSVATWDGLFALRGRTVGSSSLSLQAAAELLRQLEIPIPLEALQAAAAARRQEKEADAAEQQAEEAKTRSQQQPGSKPSNTAGSSEPSPQDQAESQSSQSLDGAGQPQWENSASDESGHGERGGVGKQSAEGQRGQSHSDSGEDVKHGREEEEKGGSPPHDTTGPQREDSDADGGCQQQPKRQTKKCSDKKVKADSSQRESDPEGAEKPHAKRQGRKPEQMEMTPAELHAWAAQIRQQCQRQVQQIQKSFGDVLSAAIQEALNDNTPLEAVQTLVQWGLEAGQEQYLPVERKIEIARHIGRLPKLAQIAKLWGRARASAMQMRSSQSDNANIGAPWGFTIGDDPSRLDDEGLAMLGTSLEESVLSDLAMQSARLNRLKGQQALAQGPLIYCGDESSSMNAHFLEGFTREEWSKGFCLGLMDIAILQRRAFTMISFGSAYEIKTRVYPDSRRIRLQDKLEIAGHFFNGGTDFERPLREAMQVMLAFPKRFQKADIVFATDGQCWMSDNAIASLVALKTRLNIRISMVVIAGQLPERHRAWADDLIPITSLTASDASARVFKSVWSKKVPPASDHKSA